MGIWSSLNGTVRVKLTTADPAHFLFRLQQMGICAEQVVLADELTVDLLVKRQDIKRLTHLAELGHCKWEITERRGLYWSVAGLKRRPVLLLGILFILLLTLYLPSRILFFRVEGNITVPTRQILALAAENGLDFGASRHDVRSEKIKNTLLGEIPSLEWVGINTSGCVATIAVRERQYADPPSENNGVSNIVAIRDGTVQEILVTAGSAAVQPGQSVTADQILISGYTDCGLTIRAERAKGEVFATTEHCLTLVLPEYDMNLSTVFGETKKISLIFGKNRINFSQSSGILDTGCVKMYEENYVTLPGGFILPLCIVTERSIYYRPAEAEQPESGLLTALAERYLQQQTVAGQIISREETVSHQDGLWLLEGRYVCLEMIGREQSEEIITP